MSIDDSLIGLFGGDIDKCHIWLKTYNHHLKAIPMDLIKSDEGAIEVAIYLNRMRSNKNE